MASINDVYNQLKDINTNLKAILNFEQNASAGTAQQLSTIIGLEDYTNSALFHLSAQNDTVICNLEKMTDMLCSLLKEAHLQTKYQEELSGNVKSLFEILSLKYSREWVEAERFKDLKLKIEKCCPPPEEAPVCTYTPCAKADPLPAPPTSEAIQRKVIGMRTK